MPRFAANLTWLFLEHDFFDRFQAAADSGFKAVEMMFPYDYTPDAIAQRLSAAKLELVLFNFAGGNWAAGERGIGALPGREEEFSASLAKALEYAQALGCPRLHAMTGLAMGEAADETARANLARACEAAAAASVTIMIEPINHRDIPGYYLNRLEQARRLIEAVGADNLKIQFDAYHTQITEGDLSARFNHYVEHIGHVQIAGNPGRNEPDRGEIHYPYLFSVIDQLNYPGWIGCEYKPLAGTKAGLGWARSYGIG